MQDRFLRDGILDEMIEYLRHLDMRSWPRNEKTDVVFASLIQLFHLQRNTLAMVEQQIEDLKKQEPASCGHLIDIARQIQHNLAQTVVGIQDGLRSY